jgi:rhodanese-related sulfurtransferase
MMYVAGKAAPPPISLSYLTFAKRITRGDNPETADGYRQCGGAADHLDVREPQEVEKTGKVAGAVNVSRGFLEFRADRDSPSHDKNFAKDKNVIVYCASGGRAALSGKLLKDMGYERVYNLGGFKDWADADGEVEK